VNAVLAERKGVSDDGKKSRPIVIMARRACSKDKLSAMKVKISRRKQSQYAKVSVHSWSPVKRKEHMQTT
jgi:hypothetical protein